MLPWSPGADANNSKMSQNTTIKKRERRPNYTIDEKALLAELVTQYHHIVEDKRTGGIFYRKKREAWKVITVQYNRRAQTGPRGTENLKILYDNMKQQAKRNDGECLTNTTLKIRLFELFRKEYYQNRREAAEEEAGKALQTMREEKLNERGGNFYRPKPNDPDGVEPLSNRYDSAAAYFRDNVSPEPAPDPVQFLDMSLPNGLTADSKFDSVNNTREHASWGSQPAAFSPTPPEPIQIKLVRKQSRPLPLEALKRLYFKRKCQNANLERKKILQEISFAQEKHGLEMIILRRALDKQ